MVSSSSTPKSLDLKQFLREHCFVLSFDDEPNVLTREQSLIVRDIGINLEETKAEKTIIKELKKHCSEEKCFKKALMPSMLQKEGLNIAIEQDSLIRLLLKVDKLQSDIIDFILDEITNVASNEEDNPSWLRLLLNPLRYLPNINKSEELTTKLLDILEISREPIQLEILDILPEILPDIRYNQASKQLVTFLNSGDCPIAATVDCLSALNLEDDVKAEIQNIILSKILPGKINNFPVLMEFLIGSGSNNNNKDNNIILKIRDILDNVMSSSNSNSEKESSKVLIFSKLKLFLTTRKQFVVDCIDMINSIRQANDHKPIDLFLLFLIHSTVKNKKRVVDVLFRKKVKDNILKYEIMEKMFQNNYLPQQVFKDMFYSILETGSNLIRSSEDPSVRLFTENLFKILFAHSFTEGIYRKEILDNLLLLAGSNEKKQVDQILNILLLLINDQCLNKVKPHTIILMRLLEKLDSFELKAVKGVFEILCSLTCSDENDESMMSTRDEVHMIIRKQLSSSKKEIKFRGVVGAVVMAKYIARISEDEEENDENESISDISSIERLPRGKSRNAAKLIDMANSRVTECHECMGLFYDQLALMLSTPNDLERHFLTWMSEMFRKDFMEKYVVEKWEKIEINDLVYSSQFGLRDSNDDSSFVNIGPMTVEPQKYGTGAILILACHFRLVRLLLHKKNNGDISNIDSSLDSPIILPEVDEMEDLDHDQLRQYADCLFHCVNWFRELISAFIFSKPLRPKVMQRLQELILLEKKLNECLSRIPGHLLPQSYFDSITQNKQNDNRKKQQPQLKKLKSKETIHDDTTTSNATLGGKNVRKKSASTSAANKTAQDNCHVQFREIDPDFLILLKLKMSFDPEERGRLTTTILVFVLKDLLKKLDVVITRKKISSSPVASVKPMDLIKDLIKILPYINSKLSNVKERLCQVLEDNDNRQDLPVLFNFENDELKKCFGLILECYSLILSWPDLQHSKNIEMVKELISGMRIEDNKVNSVNFLAAELISLFGGYVNVTMLITQGVSIVKIMKILGKFSQNVNNQKEINKACSNLLNRRWYGSNGNLDSGRNYLDSLAYLTDSYLETMKVSQINELISNVLIECENMKTKDDYLSVLASVDFKNFHVFYQGLCNALHNGVKNEVQALTNAGHLELWKNMTEAMQNLKAIAQTFNTTPLLSAFLKKSVAILRIFISHGMPIFEIMFASNKNKIIGIVKSMQTSTRFLHHVCCDSKVKKRITLTPHIPNFRLLLEQLIYKVKALLAANDCQEAFFMGNLKNKDLEGNTQMSTQDDDDDSQNNGDDDNEEMPDDDESDMETVCEDDESRGNGNKSDSDVFD